MDLALSVVQNQFFFFYRLPPPLSLHFSVEVYISTVFVWMCAFARTRAQLLFVRIFPDVHSLSHYYLSLEGFSRVGCLMGFVFGLDGFWNTSHIYNEAVQAKQSDRELNNTLFNPSGICLATPFVSSSIYLSLHFCCKPLTHAHKKQ